MRREYIINWFIEKSTISKTEIEGKLQENYINSGLIDSFAFLELISACEKEYNIRFDEKDFQNDDIFTISGLIRILEEK